MVSDPIYFGARAKWCLTPFTCDPIYLVFAPAPVPLAVLPVLGYPFRLIPFHKIT